MPDENPFWPPGRIVFETDDGRVFMRVPAGWTPVGDGGLDQFAMFTRNVVRDGAAGDGVALHDAVMGAGSHVLTSNTSIFSAATDVGKVISVMGAGAGGMGLATVITGVSGIGSATLRDPAVGAVSGVDATYGTDNATSFAATAALFASGSLRGSIFVPAGIYMTTAPFVIPGGVTLFGTGNDYYSTFQGSLTPDRSTVIISAGEAISSVVQLGTAISPNHSGFTCARARELTIDGHETALVPIETIGRNAEILNCTSWRGREAGGRLTGSNPHAYDSVFSQNLRGHGLQIRGAADVKVTRCEVRGGYKSNINVHSSSDTTILDCHAYSGAAPNTVDCPDVLWDGMSRSALMISNCKLDAVNGPAIRLHPGGNPDANDLAEAGGNPANYALASLSRLSIIGNTLFNHAALPDATWPVIEFRQDAPTNRVKGVSIVGNNWWMISVPTVTTLADAAINTGTPDLGSASATFVPTDVGKKVTVAGAGVAGATLFSRILTYVNAHAVTLTDNASTSVSGAAATYTLPVQQWTAFLAQTGAGATNILTDAVLTAGSPTLGSSSAAFVSADKGKPIRVPGAGAGGGVLSSSILAVIDAHTITLADNAWFSVSGATAIYTSSNAAFTHSGITVWGNAGAYAAQLFRNIEPVTHGGNITTTRDFVDLTDSIPARVAPEQVSVDVFAPSVGGQGFAGSSGFATFDAHGFGGYIDNLLAAQDTFTVTFHVVISSVLTAVPVTVPWGSSAAALQTAANGTAMSGRVSITGTPDTYAMEYIGDQALTDVALATVDVGSVSTTTPGDGSHDEVQTLSTTISRAWDRQFGDNSNGTTYTMSVWYDKGPAGAVIDFSIGGIIVLSVDTYAASPSTGALAQQFGITAPFASAGIKRVKMEVNPVRNVGNLSAGWSSKVRAIQVVAVHAS